MFNILFKWKLNRIKKRGERYKQEKELRDVYAEYVPERKKRKVSNIMLVISVIAIVGYLAVDVWLQYHMGIELSPTITPYWFIFWNSEIFALAGIRIKKANHESYSNDSAVG